MVQRVRHGLQEPHDRVEENADAVDVALGHEEVIALDQTLPPATGARYPEASMAVPNG